MNNGNNFDFTYQVPTEEERREIEDIKKGYQPQQQKGGKLDRLRRLDSRVKKPPLVVSTVAGICGILVAGLGLTMVLEWGLIAWGVPVGIIGIAIAAMAYPVYKWLIKRNKRLYGEEILKLSEELLNRNGEE